MKIIDIFSIVKRFLRNNIINFKLEREKKHATYLLFTSFTILFLSVVVLKCVNINIEAHSLKIIVHFIMFNLSFCLNFDVWGIFGII